MTLSLADSLTHVTDWQYFYFWHSLEEEACSTDSWIQISISIDTFNYLSQNYDILIKCFSLGTKHPAMLVSPLSSWIALPTRCEVGALRHFLSDFRQDCHPSWWKFRWIARIGENWGDKIVTKFGDTLGDDFVTYCFTQYGDFFGELPEMVRIKVTKMSPNLVTNLVTILSLFISPIMVIFGGICQNWW